MTFLKKLGQILLNVTGIAVGIGPIIQPFLGSGKAAQVVSTGTNDLTAIAQAVLQIEVALGNVPGSTGAQKLQAVLPLVGNIVKTSELVSGKKIADEAKFTLAIQELSQGAVDLLQSIHPDEAKG